MKNSRSRRLLILLLLILGGFFLRSISLDVQSLWRDEVDALRFATAPWAEMVGNFARPGWNGPLYYVVLRGWVMVAGTTEYAMRFLSLLFGLLTIPLLFVLGHRLFGSPVGIVSATLVSASPYLVWYSQEVKMYTLVLGLALLAVYSLQRALAGGDPAWWAIQIVSTSLAFYAHIFAALLVPVQALIAIIWWRRLREHWRGALISLVCLTVPYLPLAVWQAPMALQARETGFHPYSLSEMVVILLNSWSTGIKGWGGSWAAALIGLLAVTGLLTSVRLLGLQPEPDAKAPNAEHSRAHLVALTWLVLPLLFVWLISLRQPLFADRYLIWTAPAFYLLAAKGLIYFASARDWTRWVIVPLLSAILVVSGVNIWFQGATTIKADFRAAAAYVAQYRAEGATSEVMPDDAEGSDHVVYLPALGPGLGAFDDLIVFQIPHAKYAFDYYFRFDDYPRADGLYTNHLRSGGGYRMGEDEVARQMTAITRGYDTVWLVATEVPMWDERDLVKRWLERHAQRRAGAHFNRIDVYRYALNDR